MEQATLPLEEWLSAATSVAHEAGAAIMAFYQREIAIQTKGGDARNLVTEADLAAEALIRASLLGLYPEHAFVGEESGTVDALVDPTRPTWVVDPIDGTSNFAHRLPLFAVSIGLTFGGVSQVGVVHAPAMGWTFAAAAAQGATLNQRPLRVSPRDALAQAIVACDWSRLPTLRRRTLAAYATLAEEAHTLRSMGSAALGFAAVAAGWIDLYFNFSLAPWDTAAGSLLVQEAGGTVTALDGQPWTLATPAVLVTNGPLHATALDRLAPHLPDPTP